MDTYAHGEEPVILLGKPATNEMFGWLILVTTQPVHPSNESHRITRQELSDMETSRQAVDCIELARSLLEEHQPGQYYCDEIIVTPYALLVKPSTFHTAESLRTWAESLIREHSTF